MTETYDQARTRLYLAHDGLLPEADRDYLRRLEAAEGRPVPTPESLWAEIRALHQSRRPGSAGILPTTRRLRRCWDAGEAEWRGMLRDRVAGKLEALRALREAERLEEHARWCREQMAIRPLAAPVFRREAERAERRVRAMTHDELPDAAVYQPQPGEDTAVPEGKE